MLTDLVVPIETLIPLKGSDLKRKTCFFLHGNKCKRSLLVDSPISNALSYPLLGDLNTYDRVLLLTIMCRFLNDSVSENDLLTTQKDI